MSKNLLDNTVEAIFQFLAHSFGKSTVVQNFHGKNMNFMIQRKMHAQAPSQFQSGREIDIVNAIEIHGLT